MYRTELTVSLLSSMQTSEVSSKLMIVVPTPHRQNRNGLIWKRNFTAFMK